MMNNDNNSKNIALINIGSAVEFPNKYSIDANVLDTPKPVTQDTGTNNMAVEMMIPPNPTNKPSPFPKVRLFTDQS